MLVHGSHAAELRGHMPPRPDNHKSDIDIYGTQEELDLLVKNLNDADEFEKVTVMVTNFPQRRYIFRRMRFIDRRNKNIEYEIWTPDLIKQFEALPDNKDIELFGVPCKLVSPVTDVIIKRSLRFLVPDSPMKHQEDVAFYEENNYFGNNVTPEHLAAFRSYRKHLYERYKT